MSTIEKLLPAITEESKPFWDAARQGTLLAQKCRSCGKFRKMVLPETLVCADCLSPDYDWVSLAGRGVIYSFVVVHRPFHPAFQESIPYNLAIIQLDEGTQMVSNIVGLPNEALLVGTPVQVTFDQVSDSIWLPRFTAAAGSQRIRKSGGV